MANKPIESLTIPEKSTFRTSIGAEDATNLTSGTVPDARFPATLPTVSGVNLTALNATNLTSGTVPDARFPATLPTVSGVNLTALNATNLTSGTVPDARFPATLPSASGVNLTALNATNLTSGTVPDARFPATLPTVSGINLTALNATNLTSGTVPDARFPATLPTVSGINLTALNATNLNTGTVAVGRLGTGTASSTTYLAGDGTWKTPATSGTPADGSITAVKLATNAVNLPDTTVTGTLPIAKGGTNATTAATARASILPSFANNGGKVLAVNAGATDVEYIAAAGGVALTNASVNAVLDDNPAASRAAIVAASDGVGMLDRFDRYPAGTIFQHGAFTAGGVTSPEIGAQWRYSQASKNFTVEPTTDIFTSNAHGYTNGVPVTVVSSGILPTNAATGVPLVGIEGGASVTYFVRDAAANTFKLAATLGGAALDITNTGTGTHKIGAGPIITSDGGLRFFPGELGYIGTDAGENIRSLTVELKWDINVGGANTRNGLTFGFYKDPILSVNGNGIYPTGIIHTQLTNAGVATNDIFSIQALGVPIGETSSSPFPWGNQLAGGGVPWGQKHTITFEFEGDEMRVIAFGKTHRWKNAAIATAGYRHWWMEAEGYSLTSGETPTFYRVWINAPKLDHAPGWGVQSPCEVLNQLSTSGPVTLPQQIIRLTGGTTASPNGNINVPLHVRGTTLTGQAVSGGGIVSDGRIKVGTPFTTDVPLGSVAVSYGRVNAPIASTAGTDQTFNLVSILNTFPIAGKSVGDVQEITFFATLGANVNTKQLKLFDWLGSLRLTLPSITQNGGTVRFRIRQQVLTAFTHDFQVETTLYDNAGLQLSATFTRTSLNYGQGYFGGNWKSTGVTAGDITVFGGTNVYYPCGDS